MPLQNRVDPFGALFATPHRGAWMGNRGRLHDAQRNIVRRWAGKCWIACALQFKDYRRAALMRPDSYTELFFLDEATAYAAGHRPCAECRRADYNRFKAAFTAVHPAARTAADLDAILHRERTGPRAQARPADLPDGAMVAEAGQAWLKAGAALRLWTPAGYAEARALPQAAMDVLTPATTVALLRAGLPVQIDASAG